MADKFPAIEDLDNEFSEAQSAPAVQEQTETADDDFLKREKELLGDDAGQFGTELDNTVQPEQDEISKFESAFPDVSEDAHSATTEAPAAPQSPTVFSEPEEPKSKSLDLNESEAIKEWKERRTLEIQRRDEVSEAKKVEIRDVAKSAINDFYDNYNSKKEAAIEKTREEEREFLEERDNFFTGESTTWDRVLKLIDSSETAATAGKRDKTRFREILLSLKGKTDVPGAGGY